MKRFIHKLVGSEERAYRLFRVALFIIVTLGSCQSAIQIVNDIFSPSIERRDFLAIYLLPKAISEGVNPYLDLDHLIEKFIGHLYRSAYPYPTPHPPTLGLILLPLSLFDYQTARLIWYISQVALLCFSYGLISVTHGYAITIKRLLIILVVLHILQPVKSDMIHGNVHCFMLALMSFSWFAMTKGRSAQAGWAIGVLVIVKQIAAPLLLVPIVLKNWRALVSAVVTICIGYTLSTLAIGVNPAIHYFTKVLPQVAAENLYVTENFSLWTIGPRIFYGMAESPGFSFPSTPFFYSESFSRFFMYGIPAMLILISTLLIFRMRGLHFRYGYLCGLIVVVSPFTWGYYFIFALIPIAVGWICLHRNGFPNRESAFMLMACLMVISPYFMWILDLGPVLKPQISMLILSPTYGVLILLWLMNRLDSMQAGISPLPKDKPHVLAGEVRI